MSMLLYILIIYLLTINIVENTEKRAISLRIKTKRIKGHM